MKMTKRSTLEARVLEGGTVQLIADGEPHNFSPEIGKQLAFTFLQAWFRPTKPPEPPKTEA